MAGVGVQIRPHTKGLARSESGTYAVLGTGWVLGNILLARFFLTV